MKITNIYSDVKNLLKDSQKHKWKTLSEILSELRYKNVCTQFNSWGTHKNNEIAYTDIKWHDMTMRTQ